MMQKLRLMHTPLYVDCILIANIEFADENCSKNPKKLPITVLLRPNVGTFSEFLCHIAYISNIVILYFFSFRIIQIVILFILNSGVDWKTGAYNPVVCSLQCNMILYVVCTFFIGEINNFFLIDT